MAQETIAKQTAYLLAALSAAVGFLGGVVFSIYKLPQTVPPPVAQTVQPDDASRRITELRARTTADPSDSAAWAQLGHIYFDTEKFSDAVAAYETALSLDANQPDVWTDLGVMYRRTGQPAKAVEAFDKAIALNPRHEIARFNKGVVLMHDLEDTEGALRSWKELVDINPLAKAPNGQSIDQLIEHYTSHEKAASGN